MTCSKDVHGVVVRVYEDSAIVDIPGIDPEERLPFYVDKEQYDLEYKPTVGDKVVLAWFGDDDALLLRPEK